MRKALGKEKKHSKKLWIKSNFYWIVKVLLIEVIFELDLIE